MLMRSTLFLPIGGVGDAVQWRNGDEAVKRSLKGRTTLTRSQLRNLKQVFYGIGTVWHADNLISKCSGIVIYDYEVILRVAL